MACGIPTVDQTIPLLWKHELVVPEKFTHAFFSKPVSLANVTLVCVWMYAVSHVMIYHLSHT